MNTKKTNRFVTDEEEHKQVKLHKQKRINIEYDELLENDEDMDDDLKEFCRKHLK